ncbi:hypothetical protein AAKU55_004278 [Oxalobacteraceae bacterium GrIS 1.11]
MVDRRKAIPGDSLLQLRQRLDRLPRKSPERATQIAAMSGLYGVSTTTVYRALQVFQKPHAAPDRQSSPFPVAVGPASFIARAARRTLSGRTQQRLLAIRGVAIVPNVKTRLVIYQFHE